MKFYLTNKQLLNIQKGQTIQLTNEQLRGECGDECIHVVNLDISNKKTLSRARKALETGKGMRIQNSELDKAIYGGKIKNVKRKFNNTMRKTKNTFRDIGRVVNKISKGIVESPLFDVGLASAAAYSGNPEILTKGSQIAEQLRNADGKVLNPDFLNTLGYEAIDEYNRRQMNEIQGGAFNFKKMARKINNIPRRISNNVQNEINRETKNLLELKGVIDSGINSNVRKIENVFTGQGSFRGHGVGCGSCKKGSMEMKEKMARLRAMKGSGSFR